MLEPSVQIKGLSKKFGSRHAVKNLDLVIGRGECLGLLGPNGAGKSTTIRMILGLVIPTSGSIRILGLDMARHARTVRMKTGVVPQNDNLDPDLTVEENLLTYASYFGMGRKEARARISELLGFIALENRKNEIIQHLSGGQRRRLLLARALVNRPEILILDEPTVGLDPQARKLIWQRLEELLSGGVTMLLTSHYIEEVETLADQVVIIDRGRLIAGGRPDALARKHVGRYVIEVSDSMAGLLALNARAVKCGMETEISGNRLYIYVRDNCMDLDRSLDEFRHFTRRPASLEDVFLRLTGRNLRES